MYIVFSHELVMRNEDKGLLAAKVGASAQSGILHWEEPH